MAERAQNPPTHTPVQQSAFEKHTVPRPAVGLTGTQAVQPLESAQPTGQPIAGQPASHERHPTPLATQPPSMHSMPLQPWALQSAVVAQPGLPVVISHAHWPALQMQPHPHSPS